MSLVGVTASALWDDEPSWPAPMDLNGFNYKRLYSRQRSWQERAMWLRRQSYPDPNPYLHLATVYRANGEDDAARKILIERHKALLNPPPHWKPLLPAGRVRRAWRTFLGLAVGHGYEPWRALLVAAPLVVIMLLWYADAKHHDLLVATAREKPRPTSSRCNRDYPCVQPLVYVLDNLVPIVNFGQRDRWVPDQSRHAPIWVFYRDGRWLAAITWFVSALGWALATLVAASFTHVIRRD